MKKVSEAELAAALREAAKLVTVGGRYQHYRQGTYAVRGLALDEKTLEPQVIYQAEYGSRVIFTRPLASWLETVKQHGVQVPRFLKIDLD